jgi:hypothetical protein
MAMQSPSKVKSFGFRILLVVMTLLLLCSPAFAKVRRTTSRILTIPENVVTKRKANFKPGDILGTPLISMTIHNDSLEAFLLLQLDIEFGGTWENESASVELVKKFSANESLTFSNTDLLDFVSDIRSGAASEGLEDAIGVSDLSAIEDVISSITSFPEGTYTLSLKAYEITLSDPTDIRSSITSKSAALKEVSVSFNVVTIGALTILETPTVDNLELSFRVPQIPYYSDTSIPTNSTTRVTITGAGVSQTLSKSHGRSRASLSSNIKGYPSDLNDGEVTYDLSDIPFRAGEKYNVIIEFNDGYGYSITSKTIEFNAFSVPRLTTSLDTTSPFLPEFSWDFSGLDYTPWAKEYRIYLNGKYLGYTTADSYTPTSALTPNTVYNWYVMPINKDGTPFFASTSGLIKTFTTKTHNQLEIQLENPNSNATLLTGETYGFAAAATFSDNASLQSATWKIGTENKSGLSISYTPNKRYASNSLLAYLTVVDSLNLTKNSATLSLTVLDPALAIAGQTTRTVNKDESVLLSIDSQNTRDLEKIEWFANGESIGTGNTVRYAFDTSKNYTIYAEGTSKADINGTTKKVQASSIQLTVVGEAPVVAITRPTAVVEVLINNSLELLCEIEHENELSSVTWTMSGAESGNLGSSASKATFTPKKKGEYTISVEAVDTAGKRSVASLKVMAIDPTISISTPVANAVYALTSMLSPVIEAPNAKKITWFVNNKEINGTNLALSTLGTGTFKLYARATWDAVDTQGNTKSFTKDSSELSFTVKDLVPPSVTIQFPQDTMLLKTGTTYTLRASAQSSTLKESWWEVDGTRLSSNTYTPAPSLNKKVLLFTFKARNSDGIIGSKSVSVKLANPDVYLTPPTETSFLIGSTIPVTASVVDADLVWLVDNQVAPGWNKTLGTLGNHTIAAQWSLTARGSNGNETTFTGRSQTVDLTIFSNKAPIITSTTPNQDIIHQLSNVPVIFAVTASSENTLQTTKWNIYSEGTSIREISVSSISHESWSPGLYTVTALVSDAQSLSTTHEWTVKIIDPKVAITFPENGRTFAKGQSIEPILSNQDVSSYSLMVDGTTIGPDFNWKALSVGTHTLGAIGFYTVLGKTEPQKTTSNTVSFMVKDTTPPTFEAQGFHDGDRLVAGLRYNLQVSGANGVTYQWFKNGAAVSSSSQYSFTPSASEKNLNLKLRGTLNGLSVDKTFTLQVVDPYISIILSTNLANNNLYAPNTPIPLQYEGRDIDEVQWKIDSVPYSGQSVSLTPGRHSIDLDGVATKVRLPDGTLGKYQPTNTNGITGRDIQVAELFRSWNLTVPQKIYSGQPCTIEVTTTNESTFTQLLASLTYTVDGKVYKEEKKPLAKSLTIPSLPAGNHTLGVISTDIFKNTWSIEKPVMVYDPLVFTIARPADGERLFPDANILGSLQIESGNVDLITWRIGTSVVPNSNNTTVTLGKLPSGEQTISASVKDVLGKVVSYSIRVEVQDNFQLNLIQPSRNLKTLVGNPVPCLIGVEKAAGSSINLSEAAKNIHWLVNGQDTKETGLSYIFRSETTGDYTIQGRYAANGMVRTTAVQTITVKDIAQPVITKPINGESIIYSPNKPISLEAVGEQGATYTWMIGDKILAMGNKASFNPDGLEGAQQLRLVTTAYNRTKESLVSITLNRNTPPTLELTAPKIQYIDSALAWSATAFDVEDKQTNPSIAYTLDGIQLSTPRTRMLLESDVGLHTLTASTTDSQGVTTTRQAVFNVDPNTIPLTIESPRSGETYYKEFAIPLIASLGQGGGESAKNGNVTWSVQYLDHSEIAKQTLTGKAVSLDSKALGKVELTAVFVDANNTERARKKLLIEVKPEPIKLGIRWPHGTVVNASQSLEPQLLGLPANLSGGTIAWSLNGTLLSSINDLNAPSYPGSYTLSVQYNTASSSEKASVDFTVNGSPKLTITSPLAGKAVKTGSPLVLSATVTDDQTGAPSVLWTKEDGTVLGEGNPFILESIGQGSTKVIATATDSYGAKGSDRVTLQAYTPIAELICQVNNGQPTYLVDAATPPLPLKLTFNGGFDPQVTWRLQQDNRYMEKKGKEASFVYGELSQFRKDSAILTVFVNDTGVAEGTSEEVYRKNFPIMLTSEATARILKPVTGDVQHIGIDVPLQMAITGIKNPSFALSINGNPVEATFVPVETNLLYQGLLNKELFPLEGVYELVVTVSGNGMAKTAGMSLNLYKMRQGIFVDNIVATYDLEGGSVLVEAKAFDLPNMNGMQWMTDLSAEPVATGSTLNLEKAGLKPGNRSITVQALSNQEVLSSYSFPVKVTGPMSLNIEPNEEQLILRRGAAFLLTASAQDKEGTDLTGKAITWTSHLDGLVSTGNVLDFSTLPDLSKGNHVFTVTATGLDGTTISVLKPIQINVLEELQAQIPQQGQRENPQQDPSPVPMQLSPVEDFGPGTLIPSGPPPSYYPEPHGPGPGDTPLNPVLSSGMGNFINSIEESVAIDGFGGPVF